METSDTTRVSRWKEPQPNSGLPVEWVQKLWDRTAAMFGTKFTSQFHADRDQAAWLETWAMGLADKTATDLALGVRRMLNECSWPPSLPEFRVLCEAPKPARPEHQRFLPAPKDTKDRSEEMARIMGMLTKRMKA